MLIFFPTFRFTLDLVLLIACIYGLVYIDYVIPIMTKSKVDFFSLKGVMKAFKREDVVMLGWVHYISFDLMIGRYIIVDSQANNIPHILVVLPVVLSFMFGPTGLVVYTTLKIFFNLF